MNILKSIRRHDSTPVTSVRRKHLPWIQSPLYEDGVDGEPPKQGLQTSATQQSGLSTASRDVPRFKHYDDTHTIEFVYDMFFVATLSTFTGIHGIEDTPSLGNFVGVFTVLWFTWLQSTMFDVRFGVDSVYDRVCKAISFGITTSFMLAGALWDVTKVNENEKGFSLMAIALFISRLTLLVQYGVVAIFVRRYQKTLLPLGLMMGTLLVSSAVFLASYVFRSRQNSNIHLAFYVIISLEGLSMLLISCIWRVVSFKHTRFVARMTDATMIMLGEGVVGLAISVARIMQNSASISGSVGVTMSAVLLIYFTWMLYFDQIEHDRFGTIRQQIWAVLHYPLNLAIIMLLEGMRELVAYNTIVSVDKLWLSYEPPTLDTANSVLANLDIFYEYDWSGYNSVPQFISHVQDGLLALTNTLNNTKDNKLEKSFNVTLVFEVWRQSNTTLDTEEGQAYATVFTRSIFAGVENFILEHFGVTVPRTDESTFLNSSSVANATATPGTTSNGLPTTDDITFLNMLITTGTRFEGFWKTFKTVFWYFPSAAAVFLIGLAIMYWFGKRNKSRYEWFSIAIRMLGGVFMIGYGIVLNLTGGDFVNWGFADSPWVITVVTATFFVLVVGDNVLIWLSNRAYDSRGLVHRLAEETGYQKVHSRHGGGEGEVELSKLDVKWGQKTMAS